MIIRKHIVLFLLFISCCLHAATNKIDSLIGLLEQETLELPDDLMSVHERLGELYIDEDEFEKASEHRAAALELARKLNDRKHIVKNLYHLAYNLQRANNYPSALEYYNQVIEMEATGLEHLWKAKAFTRISSIYQALGDYDSAFKMQMEALHLHEVVKDSVSIATSLYGLATIFFYQERFLQALDYYQKTKTICDDLGQKRLIYSCLAALGSVYDKLENTEKSLYYNQQSLALAQEINSKTGIAYSFGNIASNYLAQGDFKKALEYKKKSTQLKKELKDKWGAIGSLLGEAEVYLIWEKPEQAIPPLRTSLAMAIELDARPRQLEAYQLFVDAYEQMNDKDEAFKYLQHYVALKDTLLNEKTVEQMGQSKSKYEIATREHEITLLKKENELLGKNKKIQKLQIFIFTIAVLLLLVFIGFFLSRLKYQRQMNHLLEDKNQILNQKNDEIHIKNKQLEYSNQDLQQFAYVASHDLKEPLRMINSYTTLLERRYNELFDESGKEFMHYIIDAVGRMQTLLDDLLDYSRAGNQKDAVKWVDVSDVMIMVKANLRYRLEENNAKLIVQEEKLPAIKAHSTQLLQLLQNLISNAVKFKGERRPIVIVDCRKEENNYVFSIKDNGIGISLENQEKVFEVFRRLHSREEYEGTGIGLATCKRIVSNMGGNIWVESVEGEGSTFFFTVPCPVEEPAMA